MVIFHGYVGHNQRVYILFKDKDWKLRCFTMFQPKSLAAEVSLVDHLTLSLSMELMTMSQSHRTSKLDIASGCLCQNGYTVNDGCRWFFRLFLRQKNISIIEKCQQLLWEILLVFWVSFLVFPSKMVVFPLKMVVFPLKMVMTWGCEPSHYLLPSLKPWRFRSFFWIATATRTKILTKNSSWPVASAMVPKKKAENIHWSCTWHNVWHTDDII